MSASYLDIADLGVRFSEQSNRSARSAAPYILRHISACINRNETFCLLGESGSGKTTLIRALLGLIPFQEGHIVLDGQQIKGQGKPVYRRFPNRMQLVFQDPATSLSPHRTLGQSMQEPLQVQGMKKRERLQIIYRLAEQMGLTPEALERRPGSVSGGQCQRACIGRALAAKPDILFLDEPLAALDTLTRQKVAELLVQVREQYRMTFFLVTHNLSFAARISSRVAVMYLGRIVEQAPAEQFFRQPGHPYSQALLSSTLDPALWSGERIVLKGDMSSDEATSGCVFYPRCFQRTERCATEIPPRQLLADEHEVCCHFPCGPAPRFNGGIF
jgi:oligopeptide/dipeptide ABC transporter ATP-binding protein